MLAVAEHSNHPYLQAHTPIHPSPGAGSASAIVFLNDIEEERVLEAFRTASLRGSLRTTPIPDLLSYFYRGKVTGAAWFRRGQESKFVYFKAGYPVHVRSNRLDERLGQLLAKTNFISQAQCQRSLEVMQRTKRKQGETLVEMDIMSRSRMGHILELQHQSKLINLFSWETGTYQFTTQLRPPAATIPFESTMEDILYRGIKSKFTMRRVHRLLREHFTHPVVTISDGLKHFRSVRLKESEIRLYEDLSANITLNELRPLSFSEDQAMRLVYIFKCAGLLSFMQPVVQDGSDQGYSDARTVIDTSKQIQKDPGGYQDKRLPSKKNLHLVNKQLAQALLAMNKQDYFRILSVSSRATSVQITEAFRALSKRYHPDGSVYSQSPEIQKKAAEIFSRICSAYAVLGNESKRLSYVRDLGKRPPESRTCPMIRL